MQCRDLPGLTFISLASTHQGPRIRLGALLEQDFGHPVVATVGSHMQWGQVIQCDVIDVGVILQQKPYTV